MKMRFAVLSEAVTALKRNPKRCRRGPAFAGRVLPALGQLYRTTENFRPAAVHLRRTRTLGEDEGPESAVVADGNLPSRKNCLKALQTGQEALGKYPTDSSIRVLRAAAREAGRRKEGAGAAEAPMKHGGGSATSI